MSSLYKIWEPHVLHNQSYFVNLHGKTYGNRFTYGFYFVNDFMKLGPIRIKSNHFLQTFSSTSVLFQGGLYKTDYCIVFQSHIHVTVCKLSLLMLRGRGRSQSGLYAKCPPNTPVEFLRVKLVNTENEALNSTSCTFQPVSPTVRDVDFPPCSILRLFLGILA